jgi:hypothetical protein
MGSFVIVVTDGSRIRSFHPEVLDHAERVTVERVVERRLEALRRLEAPSGIVEASAASAEVNARVNGNGNGSAASLSGVPFGIAGTIPREAAAMLVQAEMARTAGFSGNVCAECGSFEMVRSGTCETCKNCGKTSGGCS